MSYPITADDLAALAIRNIPAICNGLDLGAPERRAMRRPGDIQ